ncbi:serine hydrolase domain-containing protein [Glaciecola sp. 1036]|uniref:serine hydrolase domain-containing protein n=1 Tax=Alteromonadaceae TaxID=72275 RepID=UPI003CFCA647
MSIYFKILVAFLFLLPHIAMANQPINELEHSRDKFKHFEITSFPLGGEQTRFVWLNMPAFFNHTAITAAEALPLENENSLDFAQTQIIVDEKPRTLDAYIKSDDRIDSVVVVYRGNIIFEHYNSHTALDRHAAWSVSKVMVSAALAELVKQEKIDLTAPVKTYLPSFSHSDWGQVSVQSVADMQSKMGCNDSHEYDDPQNCVYRVDEIFNIVPQKTLSLSSAQDYLMAVKTNPSATSFSEYNSANTLILGFIIEAVTTKPLYQALAELVWQPMGAESDGLMLINSFGESYAGGGISARLNDIARFGLLMISNANSSIKFHKEVYGLNYERRSETFSAARKKSLNQLFNGDPPQQSKMQWDLIWSNGDMFKDGFSGQGLYVSSENNFVMAWFGTADKNFETHNLLPIARQLSNKLAEVQ